MTVKKMMSLSVVLVLSVFLSTTAFASTDNGMQGGTGPQSGSCELQLIPEYQELSDEEYEILRGLGYSDQIIEIMPLDAIGEILKQYYLDPSKITVENSFCTFTSSQGVGIDGDSTSVAVPMAEGSLDSATLGFTLTVLDQTDINGPSYNVMIVFNWHDVPFSAIMWQDRIAVAWGGELTLEEGSCSVNYRQGTGGSWTGSSTQRSGYYIEEVIDAGGYYYFDQVYSGKIVYSGLINFRLYARNSVGEDTKIIVQYGHQKVASAGVSLNISWPPGIGIEFGLGYDTTPQLSRIIAY